MLIDGGANINARHNWRTALENASSRGHQEVVRLLLDQGTAINPKRYNGRTAIRLATHSGHLEVVKLLLDYGADLNTESKCSDTPLIIASGKGNLKMVELLLEKRVIENKYLDVDSALAAASRNGKLEIVKLILVRVDDCAKYACRVLVGNRNLEAVRILLDHGANGECIDNALICASGVGDLEIVKLLIEKRPDLNARDAQGTTALIQASSNGRLEVVKLLLSNGADANVQDKDGLTALLRFSFLAFYFFSFYMFYFHKILRASSAEIKTLLLENGANI